MGNVWDIAEKGRHKKYQVYNIIYKIKYSEDGYTAEDLAEELGIHLKTAARHLRELWALDLIYISDWDRNYQQPVPVMSWRVSGRQADRPRPVPSTGAEQAKKYRKRKKDKKIRTERLILIRNDFII